MSYQVLISDPMLWLTFFFSCCVLALIPLEIYWWMTALDEYEIECPFDYEWKFSKADLILASRKSVDGYLQGRCFYPFNIPGLQCHLKIFPNGNTKKYRGQTWIFLQINASKQRKIAAEFKISVESANFVSQNVCKVYEENIGFGANICKTTEFFGRKNLYFVDEKIVIKVKGILKAQRPSVSKILSRLSLKWKIKEDDLKEAMKPESNDRLRSKVFNIPSFNGVRYWLELRTKVLNDKNQAQTFLFLFVEFGNYEKIEAVVEIFIDSVGYCNIFENLYESYNGYGHCICLTEDLFNPSKRYIVDGYLTIDFNGVLRVERMPRMTMKCKNAFLSRLPQLDAKDFWINIGDKQIPVHKQLLMDASPVWAGMFGSGMKESTQNETKINNFPFKIVEAAIKVMYNQNGFCTLTMEEMFILRNFANKYFIELLIDLVERALVKMISASNVCHLIHLSAPDSYNVPKLHESCVKFLNKCFLETIPIYAAESIDEKFLAAVFLRGLHPVSGIFMAERNRRMTLKCKNGLPQIQDPNDFVIVIGDKQIPVHKQLLMDVSPVWAGMFGSGMKESTENEMKIKDFPFKIVEAAIKVLCNQNGFCSLTMEEMFLLRNFANKYFIESLIDLVERALIKMISPSNVCQLIQLSAPESFNVPKLRESCIEFLAKCFKESTPVFGVESLGDKFLASVFLRGLCQISDSVTHL